MKKILVAGAVLCLLWLAFYAAGQIKIREAAALEESVRRLTETVTPVKFAILKRTADSLTVELHLYDLAGTEVGTTLRTVAGSELSVDFLVVPFPPGAGGSHIAFPYRIFTEAVAPADGIPLVDLYNGADGFPAVFENGPFTAPSVRRLLSRVYQDIRNGTFPDDSYGNALHEVSRIAEFKTGDVYSVNIHPQKGGMEIR